MSGTELLTLKWGTLKEWHLTTDASKAAFKRYADFGMSPSAMCQHDTPEQQAALLDLIDVVDTDEILLDWECTTVSKDDAKEYVRNYGVRRASKE